MFVPYFLDGPLRGRIEPLPDHEFTAGHDYTVKVAPDYVGPMYEEPAVVVRAEKPWEANKRIYRYQFNWFPILGRMVVLGWCGAGLPSEAALFDALINPTVRNAVALENDAATVSNPTPGGGK